MLKFAVLTKIVKLSQGVSPAEKGTHYPPPPQKDGCVVWWQTDSLYREEEDKELH
jgi:hypothetical protein